MGVYNYNILLSPIIDEALAYKICIIFIVIQLIML